MFSTTLADLYRAWLDSDLHSAMTGSPAHAEPEVGSSFTAWDGYISGANLELTPGKRIVQSWRTLEFEANEDDSRLELTLEPVDGNTLLTLTHSNLPSHGMQYEQGWIDNYFIPMKVHFTE